MPMGSAEPEVDQGGFDPDAFYVALDAERHARNLNWRQVAGEAGVSQSTLTRLGQGRRPDVDSFSKLVAWGDLAADDYLGSPRRVGSGEFLAELPSYLRADPNLSAEGARSLETIIRAAYDQFRKG